MLIPTNHAQANFRFGGAGLPWDGEITMGLNTELQTPPEAELPGLLAEAWQLNMAARCSSSIELQLVRVKYGPNDLGPMFEEGVVMPGTIGGSTEVPNVSVLISKATGVGGRAGRGRLYHPGADEGNFQSDGVMNATRRGQWQTSWDAFIDDVVALGTIPVLLHSHGSPITQPLPITSWTVQSRAATQRRRLRR